MLEAIRSVQSTGQWGAHVPVPIEDDPDFAGGRSFTTPRTGGRTAAVIRGRGGENRELRPMRAGDRNGMGLMLDDDTIVVPVGKKQAGRELDGRTWDEFPAAVGA
jgi:hypothetical protein